MQVGKTIHYDPAYVALKYPGGDVPIERGVCADVVVRALRHAGVDLQQAIHEDMKAHFDAYPNHWRLKKPDPNIDHRRVPNIVTYYTRQKKSLSLPVKTGNVRVGDLIAWELPDGRPHIGVVTSTEDRDNILLVHNIGAGARQEAVLKDWKITAHLRPFK